MNKTEFGAVKKASLPDSSCRAVFLEFLAGDTAFVAFFTSLSADFEDAGSFSVMAKKWKQPVLNILQEEIMPSLL